MGKHRKSNMCTLFVVLLHSAVALAQSHQYGLVIDAGSSGSRIAIYRWLPRAGGGFDAVEEVVPSDSPKQGEKEIEPGVSSYANDPAKAGPSLQPLLLYAAQIVPNELHRETPIFLGATAGMRLLSPKIQNKVMKAIRRYLQSSKCPFKFVGSNARIISGEEEGVFGWIQLNFLLGLIGRPDSLSKAPVAAFDLGGASTQITFEPPTDIMAHIFPVVFDRIVHRLYTHSYLHFGTDRALQRVFDTLLRTGGNSSKIEHPCYLNGLSEKITDRNTEYELVGTGDPDRCESLVKSLLLMDTPCMNEPCGIAGVYQPPIGGLSYGMSNFYYYAKGLGLTDSEGQWSGSIESLSTVTKAFCRTPWADAQVKFPKEKPKYLKGTCFKGIYIEQLLTTGFGYPRNEDKLVFAGSIDGDQQTGWTLGLLLYELQLVPVSIPESVRYCTASSSIGNHLMLALVPASLALVGFMLGFLVAKRTLLRKSGKGKKTDMEAELLGRSSNFV